MSDSNGTTPTRSRSSSQAEAAGSEFLVFTLGDEEYGIDILKVQEIRGYDTVTRIANAPDFIKGVMNLRGIIVPVVDMRIRFRLGEPTYDQFTVVVILNVGARVVGMVVDSVSDVTTLTREQIKPAPEMGTTFEAGNLIGLGTLESRMQNDEAQTRYFGERIAALNEALAVRQRSLETEYVALETVIQRAHSQSSWLTSAIDKLNGTSSSSSESSGL